MDLSREVKTGLFFLVGLIVLGAMTFKVEDVGALFKKQYELHTFFKHAAGLSVGDRVAIAGVPAGEVNDIRLHDEKVEVVMLLDQDKTVKKDAVATIGWSNLLGGRYVDITIGSPRAPVLAHGAHVHGKESIEISRLMAKFDAAANELRTLLKPKEGGLASKIDLLVTNMVTISEQLKSGKGTLGKLINDSELYGKINGIADELRDGSKQLKKILSRNEEGINKIVDGLSEAAPEMRKAVKTIQDIAKRIGEGKGTMAKLINDDALFNDLKEAVASVKSFTQKLDKGEGAIARLVNDKDMADEFRKTIHSLQVITERIEKGDNTLGKLTKEKDIYVELKKLLKDAQEAVRGVKEQIPVGTFTGILLSAF